MRHEVVAAAKVSLYKMNATFRQKIVVELLGIAITALITGV
ncbi:MAG: hypothetical protein RI894_2573, partial [Bacteroidota bacterium]